MLYMVTQTPKRKYGNLLTAVVFVEASTGAAAIRQAITEFPEYVIKTPHPEVNKPYATPLIKSDEYNFVGSRAYYF